jgi:hypothetical protein
MSNAERPVLIGGTGRSGSTIVGHILDHHPDLTLTRPMEVRFITGNDGLADALAIAKKKPGSAKASAAAQLAVSRILERWFERAENVGLHTSMSKQELTDLCDGYLRSFSDDPLAASSNLTRSIMAKVAASVGADRWVDTTPANARKADRVEAIYPESVVIVVHRDGRDVAASFVHQNFGPDDVFEALDQWEQRMLRIHKAVERSRPDRVVEVDLVDLVINARIPTLERICRGIDVPLAPTMVEWFNANVTEQAAHGGRWRRDFDATTCDRLDQAYADACQRLMQVGVRIPPAA